MISVFIYQKTRSVVVINWDVLESVGREHDAHGIRGRYCPSFDWDKINFLPCICYGTVFWI